MKKVTVLLADDNPDMLCVIQEMLRPGFDVIATANDGYSLVAAVVEHRPDIIITDISMPGMNGIEAAGKILKLQPKSKIVMLTINRDLLLVDKALSLGALGYVLKMTAGEDLLHAINQALQGNRYVSPAIKYQGSVPIDKSSGQHRILKDNSVI